MFSALAGFTAEPPGKPPGEGVEEEAEWCPSCPEG